MYKFFPPLFALAMLSLCPASVKAAPAGGSALVASSKIAIAETQQGKVQGFVKDDILTFRGITYATAGRFLPPQPSASWTDVRPALSYGKTCPQPANADMREPQTFISDSRYWPQSEACQNLNIWTPALKDGKKRPVMVWLHGGGYFSGSSMELPVYDGENLSKKGDVVVVSINHRLNILGFLDLSAYGPQYKYSGNVGMLDIIAALQWVRDNIDAFGGDPSNVTIFGQSGGGGKVSTLLAAPLAQGLFNKAIIQSGIMGGVNPEAGNQAVAKRVAELTITEAGLKPGDVQGLATLPYDQLAAAGDKALRKISDEIAPGKGLLGFPIINWGPVADGDFLPRYPFMTDAPSVSAKVPLLIGSTLNEFEMIPKPDTTGRANWGEKEVAAYLNVRYGAKGPAILAAYKKAYPAVAPRDWVVIDSMGRGGVLRASRLKAAQTAPVYTYLFAWQSPVLDGFWGAGHSTDLTFTFDNPELGEQATGGGPAVAALADKMSQAWINFARKGDPNQPGQSAWKPFTPSGGDTMIFDTHSEVRANHDRELVDLLTTPPTR